MNIVNDRTRRALVVVGAALLAVIFLYPNPFGNAPDSIGDESYFLSSNLNAFQHHTLPGWDFGAGSYYGGVETYLGTIVLAPVVAGAVVVFHSIARAELWVALHTGDLLHLIRLVNGAMVLAAIGGLAWFFWRRRAPGALVEQIVLFALLLAGSSIFMTLAHSAKVWVIAVLVDATVGLLVIANEYYRRRGEGPLLTSPAITAVLVWAGIVTFFQNFVSVFSIGLWTLWALWFGQIRFGDLVAHIRRFWYLIVLVAATQVSFIYRAIFVKSHNTIFDPGQVAPTTATGAFDWYHRLHDPVVWAFQGQPLLVFALAGLILVVLKWRTGAFSRPERRYLAVAIMHPVATYLIFYAGLGFSLFPRYAIVLLTAAAFSTVMLVSFDVVMRRIVLAAATLLFAAVSVHTIGLYWRPSSTVELTREIEGRYNTATTTFVVSQSAWRLALPLNQNTVLALNDRRAAMSRFSYLRAHLNELSSQPFLPTTLYADSVAEEQAFITAYQATSSVWTISADCSDGCSVRERADGSCFVVNESACDIVPQEPDILTNFFKARELGNAYVVRKESTTR